MASTVETTAVALRGGNHDASLNFTGISKELVADMGSTGDGTDATTTTLRLHNGITSGGIPMMRADTMNMSTRVLAEGRGKIGDKNLSYNDLSNFSDTTDSSDTNLLIRQNIIQILTASTKWTSPSLLLTTKSYVTDEIRSAKNWVNEKFIAGTDPGDEFSHPANNVAIPTTFTAAITSTGTNMFSGSNTFSGTTLVPNINDISTSNTNAANTKFVHDVVNSVDATVVHLSGQEQITGDKTFTGTVNLTGAGVTVATAPAGTSNNTVASTKFVMDAIDDSSGDFVTIDTMQTITNLKKFDIIPQIKYDDPRTVGPAEYSDVACVDYVDYALENYGEDMVLTVGINDADKLHPVLNPEQHIYCGKVFDGNNGTEIANLEAAIPQDDPQRAEKIAALEALRQNNTVTFEAAISSSGTNSWSGTNTFAGQINATNLNATGTVNLTGTSRAVTQAVTDNSTKIATTEFVTQYALKVQPVISKFADAPNGTVNLTYNTKVYRVTGTVNAFTFNTSGLGTLANDDVLEFKLFIPETTNASAANIWPASVRFLNEQAPTLAVGRNYVATLFSIDKGTTWWLAMSGWNYALWG